jgi:hypothetical protein
LSHGGDFVVEESIEVLREPYHTHEVFEILCVLAAGWGLRLFLGDFVGVEVGDSFLDFGLCLFGQFFGCGSGFSVVCFLFYCLQLCGLLSTWWLTSYLMVSFSSSMFLNCLIFSSSYSLDRGDGYHFFSFQFEFFILFLSGLWEWYLSLIFLFIEIGTL